jgi:hypothetical protein
MFTASSRCTPGDDQRRDTRTIRYVAHPQQNFAGACSWVDIQISCLRIVGKLHEKFVSHLLPAFWILPQRV